MSLQNETAEWDGKSADQIRAIFAKYQQSQSYADELITMLDFEFAQRGASWQLKALLESGKRLSPDQIENLAAVFNQLDHWESRLHILQSIPYLPIPSAVELEFEAFIRQSLDYKNKFVRAWAYTGFYELAVQYPEYQSEAMLLLNKAMEQESGSIKVRVRKALQKGF